QRNKLNILIQKHCQFFSITQSSVSIINNVGVGKATQIAFRKSISEILKKVKNSKVFVLVDGFHIKYIQGIGLSHQKAIVKGDQKSISIAASSIMAKVYRDNLMIEYDKQFPNYLFS